MFCARVDDGVERAGRSKRTAFYNARTAILGPLRYIELSGANISIKDVEPAIAFS
jgi:hypothetical protein